MRQIQRLPDEEQAADDIDIVMVLPDPAFGRAFYRISKSARWRRNPELALEVKRDAADASNTFSAKVAGKAGVALFDDFRAAARAQ